MFSSQTICKSLTAQNEEEEKTIPHAIDEAKCLSAFVSEMVMGITAWLVASSF